MSKSYNVALGFNSLILPLVTIQGGGGGGGLTSEKITHLCGDTKLINKKIDPCIFCVYPNRQTGPCIHETVMGKKISDTETELSSSVYGKARIYDAMVHMEAMFSV